MVSAVGRMRVLINDLLIFSRAGRITPDTIAEINLNELLRDVLGDLDVPLQDKKGAVQTDPLPVIEGSDTGLHQLFQNILSNSIKFAAPERPLLIRITGETLTGYEAGVPSEKKAAEKYLRIRVQDNGIGFDPAYADRIFLIFQRLHGVSEYKGTGIGLAICKKIVEAHQGYISAEGSPGNGAAFIITLPLKQMRED
ncbi:ATP-binding protein [Chitinophaga pollutisoli]|uniref:histidine kinase n=1 Tax=Chitinophaga pollutisoli TaxID=3133966 RepID=A0ABZ2YHL7_9BACT